MEFGYPYTRLRKQFGRQCIFMMDQSKVIEDVKPDKSLETKYVLKNPVEKGVQVGYSFSEDGINTRVKDYSDRGMNHIEGGWPKEVDTNDEEAVLRYRKKTERLDNYIAVMQRLMKPMEHAILQNNAINIYEKYFESSVSAIPAETDNMRIQSKFRDPQKPPRPITKCSWSPVEGQFAVAYCKTQFDTPFFSSPESYIWDLERPLAPEMTIQAESPILSLEYNTRDPFWLASGLYSGQIAHFDTRRGSTPVGVSLLYESHREPAHTVLWISSKSGAEFFSTSMDGAVMWWDCRHLEKPVEYIYLDSSKTDKPSIKKAHPPSCLEYEPSIPSRYMVGTETGYVIIGNRKGTSHQEKLPFVQKCHEGPIYSVHRNQGFSKNFLAVGSWSARIWSEDCRESAIIWTKNYSQGLTGGEWSAGRLSVFFLTRSDGFLDIWDILMDQENPTLSMRLCDVPLTTLRATEDGLLVLVGNAVGTAYVVRLPTCFAESLKHEKAYLASLFERESRREKMLEARNREIKLKQRELMMAAKGTDRSSKTELDLHTEDYKSALESQYFSEVDAARQELENRKVGRTAEKDKEQDKGSMDDDDDDDDVA